MCMSLIQSSRTRPKLPERRAARHRIAEDDTVPFTGAGAAAAEVTSSIRIRAIADWAGDTGMAFSTGNVGELTYVNPQGWVCVRVGDRTGWVKATHWRILTEARQTFTLIFSVYNTIRSYRGIYGSIGHSL